jgi:peptidoglycan hydrolase CwlO-like protein
MIKMLIVKLVVGAIRNAIEKKQRIKGLNNLKRIDDYVNKENELDKQVKQIQKNQTKILKNQENVEKDIGLLKTDSHPPIKNLEKRIKWLEKEIRKRK